MPIYEYQALDPDNACPRCKGGFEMFRNISEKPLTTCIHCGAKVKKIISWCHSAVMESPGENARVESRIKDHEKSGRWSHAAELADSHSEKTGDKSLKVRALENFKQAGYDADSMAKNAKLDE